MPYTKSKNVDYNQIEPYYSGSPGIEQGLLTAILELGAWIGTLVNGWLADAVGRRLTVVIACVVFTVGVIVQACTTNKDYVLAGRFVTGTFTSCLPYR